MKPYGVKRIYPMCRDQVELLEMGQVSHAFTKKVRRFWKKRARRLGKSDIQDRLAA